jgi:lipoprotein NlpD
VLVAAVLAACGGSSVAPVESVSRAPTTTKKAKRPVSHTVRRGETLYSIAWRFGFDYRTLAAWNAIGEPYTIYPGQKLRLTRPPSTPSTKTARRSPAPSGSSDRTASTSTSGSSGKSTKVPATPKKSAPRTSGGKKTVSAESLKKSGKGAAKGGSAPVKRWHWPARGRVVTSFSKSGGKGIDIAGKLGQSILAASDGRVVYSGSGLIGYGQLIIVKHNKRYLSAYAHNNKILVKEGDAVTGGQRIAEMGRSGSNRALLHFEIRRDGRPIDPIRYLPK